MNDHNAFMRQMNWKTMNAKPNSLGDFHLWMMDSKQILIVNLLRSSISVHMDTDNDISYQIQFIISVFSLVRTKKKLHSPLMNKLDFSANLLKTEIPLLLFAEISLFVT